MPHCDYQVIFYIFVNITIHNTIVKSFGNKRGGSPTKFIRLTSLII